MEKPGRIIPAFILILIGLSLMFDVDFWRFIIPLILIVIGLRILFRTPYSNDFLQEESTETELDYAAVFSGLNKKVVADDFSGGKITTVFGGGEIDLSGAKIQKGETADLEVNAVFGGIKLIVPSTWMVSNSVVGVFGGFANKTGTAKNGKENGRLVVKGTAIFGGGEITN